MLKSGHNPRNLILFIKDKHYAPNDLLTSDKKLKYSLIRDKDGQEM